MSVILNQSVDPRDNLDKARRPELFRFARDHGITDIIEAMPADMMRLILRSKGIINISVPHRPLGVALDQNPYPTSHKAGAVVESRQEPSPAMAIPQVDATADLARQWMQQQKKAAEAPMPSLPSKPSITDLRRECKRRGIKIARTDNMVLLKAKLDATGP